MNTVEERLAQSEKEAKINEFERLLNQSFNYNFKIASVVKGTIVKIDKNGILVDIGSKTEAILPLRELSNVPFSAPEDIVNVGDEKEFYVLKEENEEGQIAVSLKRVHLARNWSKLDEYRQKEETITVKVSSLVKSGVIVEIQELRGFIPASQLRMGTPHEALVGQELSVKILEADSRRNKLILSERLALAEERNRIAGNVVASLVIDQIVEGEIVRIADFGVFVDIMGIDGLLPISEISWQRIKHPSDVLSLGQKVEVKILNIDTNLNRISLSLKRMIENPWTKIEGEFEEGQVIKGTVNKITNFGVFVTIYPGVEALLPVSEMSDSHINPFDVVEVGQELEVLIKRFAPQERRIGLNTKDINKQF